MTATDYSEYGKCRTPDCLRKVSLSSAHCCGSCADANGRFELEPYTPGQYAALMHSEGCEQRARERGQWTVFEADVLTERQGGSRP